MRKVFKSKLTIVRTGKKYTPYFIGELGMNLNGGETKEAAFVYEVYNLIKKPDNTAYFKAGDIDLIQIKSEGASFHINPVYPIEDPQERLHYYFATSAARYYAIVADYIPGYYVYWIISAAACFQFVYQFGRYDRGVWRLPSKFTKKHIAFLDKC